MKRFITLLTSGLLLTASGVFAEDKLPRQERSEIVEDATSAAVARAKVIVELSAGRPRKEGFRLIHDFLAPDDVGSFAKKGDRLWIVRVSGYESKDGTEAYRFLWIRSSDGSFIWEP
jgi:hypothetical protein